MDRLLSLEEARSMGDELEGAADDVLRANRPRLRKLESAIVKCEQVRQRVDHAQLVYVRAFLKTGVWRMHGMRTAADWVAWRLGLEGRTARERVRVARALEGLPLTDAAFKKGEINYTKVRAVTRVANSDDEQQWLERASRSSADQLERECRETPGPQDPEEGPPRWIVSHTRPDGLVQTTLVLPPEEHALLFKSLDAAITLAHGARKKAGSDGPATSDEPVGSDGPDGSDEPVGSDGPGLDSSAASHGGSDGPRRFGRVDALLAVANHFLASQPSPASSPGRYEVQVRVDSEVLTSDPPLCELIDGTPLSPETVRRLSCDASKVVYRTDEADYPLDVGRRTRTIPSALKRALSSGTGVAVASPAATRTCSWRATT